jgi:U4/U6.U5 tri-snRNP-associated protein 1
MAEEERHKKKQEMKIKKRDYTGYDDDEFTAGKAGMKKSVLSKYDEELEGPVDTVRFSFGHLLACCCSD